MRKRTPSQSQACPSAQAAAGTGVRCGSPASRAASGCALATAGAPPAWSLSAWLTTSRSSRAMPSARSEGSTAASPRSNSEGKRAPASNTRACCRVRSTTASPCPTSSIHTRNAPSGGRSTAGHNSGRNSSAPSQRIGVPRGNSIQPAPSSARPSAHGCTAGT
ncbi:hypothetical protein FHW85_001046 [Dyella sp. SG609]|nr:hypothetical protein [Dyella sp. SG609]